MELNKDGNLAFVGSHNCTKSLMSVTAVLKGPSLESFLYPCLAAGCRPPQLAADLRTCRVRQAWPWEPKSLGH